MELKGKSTEHNPIKSFVRMNGARGLQVHVTFDCKVDLLARKK